MVVWARLTLTVLLAWLAAGSASASHTWPRCGKERWVVKTLQDRPDLEPTKKTTISALIKMRRPRRLTLTRQPSEHWVYSVTAAVTLVKPEADGDLHIVIQTGQAHMIAEAPNAPACTQKALSVYIKKMKAARSKVKRCARARVTGVAFWDFKHGQTGVAPNAIELHPILAFSC